MKALYEFLRPGASGENIQYLSSARDDIQAGHSEHSVKQSLKTIDEFFSYIVSPQTRLRPNTLGSVNCKQNFYILDQFYALETRTDKRLAVQRTCGRDTIQNTFAVSTK